MCFAWIFSGLMSEGEDRRVNMKMLTKFLVLTMMAGMAFVAAQGAAFMTPIYSFDGSSGVKDPVAGLLKGNDKNYYGTMWRGGTNAMGSVYRYAVTNATTGAGVFTNLYSFTGGTDGGNPYAGLVLGQDGFYYGTTTTGGTAGFGTLFRMSASAPYAFTTLYSFPGGSGGAHPYGDLIWGTGGLLYGTTAEGGSSDFGTVFVYDPRSLVMRDTQVFSSIGNDGGWPYGELCYISMTTDYTAQRNPTTGTLEKETWTTNAVFYGPTWGGGANLEGCVYQYNFSMNRVINYLTGGATTFGYGPGGKSTIYSFTGGLDGANPYAGLLRASDGNFYGSTVHGGTNDYGGIYRMTSAAAFARIYSFEGGALGQNPYGVLMSGLGSVNLYGTTLAGGRGDNGTIYKVNASGQFTNLYSFTGAADGGSPFSGLIADGPGLFAGTTGGGGAHALGTIFRFMPDGSVVTVTGNPVAGGTVTGSGTYLVNELVWITAVANTNLGYAFVQWSDGVTDNPRSITVPSSNITFTAIFSKTADVTVQANPAIGGAVDGSGRYSIGLVQQISAAPNVGWTFLGWSDGDITNPRTIVIPTTNITYTALFAQQLASLSVNATPANGGFVTGGGTFPVGSAQTISATPTNGFLFGSWQDGDTNPVRTVTIPANGVSYSASFVVPSSVVTLLLSTNVAGAVLGGGSYAQGSTQTISAVASAGWMFTQWSDGSVANPRTIVVPESDITYTGMFVQAALITAQVSPGSLGGSVSGGGTYPLGWSAQLFALANSNYLFTSWSCGGVTYTDNPLLVSVASNAVYTASFMPMQGVLTVVASSTNGTVLGGGTYPAGSSQKISATPNAGWSFGGWDDGVMTNPRNVIVPVNGATYTANFVQQTAVVTVLVNTNVGGYASGGGTFAVGTPHQLSATALYGWNFMGWNDGDTSNPRTIYVLQSNVTYTAMFSQQKSIVTVTVNTNAGGVATGGGSYPVGTSLDIKATPNANWLFAQWAEDGTIQNPKTILVPATNITYTAVFGEAVTITLQVNPAGAGTVSGGGLYPRGSPAQLTALAGVNWNFSSWSCGGVTNVDNPIMPIAASNTTWTANFVPKPATLTVLADSTNGTVSGSGVYSAGSMQTISATANVGWYFTGWNDGNTDNPRSVAVPAGGVTYTASFAQMGTVTVLVNTNAGGTATGGGTFPVGASQQISATPNVGWQFVQWGDGSVANPRTIVVPASNVTYLAVFASSARITVAVDPVGAGTVTGGGTYGIGSTAMLVASSNLNWVFTSWTSGTYSTNANPVGISVASNADYVAHFRSAAINVSVRPNPQAGGTTSGSGNYSAGTTQQIAAVANSGWTFTGWNDGNNVNPRSIIVPTSNVMYLANFTQNGQAQAAITVNASPVAGGGCFGGGTFTVGSSVLIGVAPADGWSFVAWSDGDPNLQRFVVVPAAGGTYTAIMRTRTAMITMQASPAVGGSVSGAGTYQVGSNVTLTAAANNGWIFTGWSDGKVANPRLLSVPASGGNYIANFTPTVAAALGVSAFACATGGNADWFGQTSVKRDGLSAAQSGAIGDGQTTWIQTTTEGAGSMLFWWKVSSEANHDYLSYIVDGMTTNRISGNADWSQFACFVGEGSHTFRWEYAKDSSGRAGSDAGWVTQVAWLPCPAATNVPQLFFKNPNGLLASWVLDTNGVYQFTRILSNIGNWMPKSSGDIDGDGTGDLLFQNAAGDIKLWFLNPDGTVRGTNSLGNTGSWDIRACADFRGDGPAQIFFQNPAGASAYWQVDTNGFCTNSVFLANAGAWQLKTAADLDNDHKAELLWQLSSGLVVAWFHTNDTIRAQVLGSTGTWELRGGMDSSTNSNGVLVWQTPDGNAAAWFVNTNGAPVSAMPWGSTGAWKIKAVSGH